MVTFSILRAGRFAAAFAYAFLLMTLHVKAQTEFEHCNAVLAGDLMDKMYSSTQAQSFARHVWQQQILSHTADEAYQLYKKDMEDGKKQGQKGSLGINYFGIGGNADFDVNYDRQLSSSEFKEKFNKAQRIFQQSGGQVDTSSSSFASVYASSIRDSASIEAWKTCVTQQPQMGLFAFASRDDSDEPFLNVVWGPGQSAATFPSIVIDISLPEGASTSDTTREVASGSGRSYRIAYPEHKRGFQMVVNANLHDKDGHLVNSFTAKAQVPRLVDQEPPPVTTPAPTTPASTSDCSFGKFTCKQGYVWRQASETDFVCVTPAIRAQTANDNATAGSREIRRFLAAEHRFIRTCRQQFVRREAFEGDLVCVTQSVRERTRLENRLARIRIACPQ